MYSLYEWEHGFLRGNRKAPHGLQFPFAKRDPRIETIVTKPDPRLHFALTNGTQRCKDTQHFTGNNLDDELRRAAINFCVSDANVRISGGDLFLNQVFMWYRNDFKEGESNRSLPSILRDIVPCCRKRDDLIEQLTKYQESIKVHPIKYEWADAFGASTFHLSALRGEDSRLSRMMRTAAEE